MGSDLNMGWNGMENHSLINEFIILGDKMLLKGVCYCDRVDPEFASVVYNFFKLLAGRFEYHNSE